MGNLIYFTVEFATTVIPSGPDVQTFGQPTDDFLSHLGCRLPLPSASVGLAIVRSWVRYSPVHIIPSRESHRPVTGTKLYCLVPEARRCEQRAQGFYAALPR